MHARLVVLLALLGPMLALVGCSQAGTRQEPPSEQPAGGGSQATGDANSTLAGSAAIAGAMSIAGSSSGASGMGSSAAGEASSAGNGGSTGGGGVGSGGLFGGDGQFPTLDLPIALPEPEPPAACPAGSIIQKVGSPALYSWPGTVFSSSPLSGQGQNHAPTKLLVAVTNAGQPVGNCEVRFRAAAGHGWGFGATKTTDQQGNLYGYWT